MPAMDKEVRPLFCYHLMVPISLHHVTISYFCFCVVNPKVLGHMAWNMREMETVVTSAKFQDMESWSLRIQKFFHKTKDWKLFSKNAFACERQTFPFASSTVYQPVQELSREHAQTYILLLFGHLFSSSPLWEGVGSANTERTTNADRSLFFFLTGFQRKELGIKIRKFWKWSSFVCMNYSVANLTFKNLH